MEGVALLLEEEERIPLRINDYGLRIMGFVKSFAKAVWAFCSYLFWPQKNKRI